MWKSYSFFGRKSIRQILRQITTPRLLLPAVIAYITGKDRYIPEFEYSNKSWTNNIFRAYESIFGREIGIRAEMSAHDEDGRWVQVAHTFEGSCALFETAIREFFRLPRFGFVEIYIPALSFAGGPAPLGSSFRIPYMIAVAFDNAAVPGSNSTSFTTSGSNRFMAAGFGSGSSGSGMAMTYNAVSLSITSGASVTLPAFSDKLTAFNLTNPASGSNTLVYSGTSIAGREVASYSGVNQTGQPEANQSTTQDSGSPVTCSITVGTTNAWIVANGYGNTALTASTGTTARAGNGSAGIAADSNAGLSTGSQSLVFTKNAAAGQDCGFMVISIAPAATALTISVSDQLNITELITMVRISLISVFDSLTITEAVTMLKVNFISVSDAITLTESVTMLKINFISVSDAITITESVTATNALLINVSDSLTLTESVTVFIPFFNIITSDQLTTTESVTMQVNSFISVSDAITITESVTMLVVSLISVSDSITITESVGTPSVSYSISVSDQLNITETISKEVSDPVKGLIHMRGKEQGYVLTMTGQSRPESMKMQEYPLGFRDQTET